MSGSVLNLHLGDENTDNLGGFPLPRCLSGGKKRPKRFVEVFVVETVSFFRLTDGMQQVKFLKLTHIQIRYQLVLYLKRCFCTVAVSSHI